MRIVAGRYAQALMNLAAGENQVQEIADGLDDLADAFQESAKLQEFLAEPKVSQAVKEATVTELLQKTQAPPLLNTFVRYVTRKRRIGLLDEMRKVYHELADERMGRANADVTVAAALSTQQESDLKERLEKLSGLEINLRVNIDPSILGGIVAKIGSTVWDGSLRNQLNQIHQSIIEGQPVK